MAYWWEGDPLERYWCEITDRVDIGADLKCPQHRKGNEEYWSYSLIREVFPGDIVFHYSTNAKAFVGASVAGGPLEERLIRWSAHGTVGRAQRRQQLHEPGDRPGWWLPLYAHRKAEPKLTLKAMQKPAQQTWITNWIKGRQKHGAVAAPVQLYGDSTSTPALRGAQGYLTKMPREFTEHWTELSDLVAALADKQAQVEAVVSISKARPGDGDGVFTPKSDADYVALINGSQQRRSRHHETLVRRFGEALMLTGAKVSTPHPLDLLMTTPMKVIFEAKAAGTIGALRAVREAVGQLYEYRHFIGPKDAALCILLNTEPDAALQTYVEEQLGLMLAWVCSTGTGLGPTTADRLRAAGITLSAAPYLGEAARNSGSTETS